MTGAVRFTAAALADLDETASWYNEQRPKLGVQSLQAVRETTERIAVNPKAFQIVAEDVRRANLPRRWPYALWYVIPATQLAGIRAIAMDMWPPYISSTLRHVPGARDKIVFDLYHIMSYMNEAVDGVRKREHRGIGRGAMRRSPDRAIYGCTRRKIFLRSTTSASSRCAR